MNLKRMLVSAGVAAVMCVAANAVMAQETGNNGPEGPGGGRRNFDPAQFQQRMMDNLRDAMSVTNDEEWKVIEGRVQKVFEARRDLGGPNLGRLFRGRGGENNPGGRRGMFGNPSPEMEALDNAVKSNAPTEQIKAAMKKYRASHKAKEAALEKAQQDLKSVLTVKQEAVALEYGLVN